jgi:ferritin-like metal-binding protein YciE
LKLENLEKLYVHQLKDLYSAETQVLKALPRIAEAANDDELADAFREHEKQTRTHISRLEKIFQALDFEPGGHHCKGAEGLIAESSDMIGEEADPHVRDAGLIASAQRFEHYEMAGYGCARAYAQKLGETAAAELLTQTLEEEGETDRRLSRMAERNLNFEALVA